MKKRLFSLLLTAVMVLSLLAGCAKKEEKPAEQAKGPRELLFWQCGNDDNARKFATQFAEKYQNQYKDVKVNIEFIPWEQAHDKIVAAIAGGQTPDVSYTAGRWVAEFSSMGGLMDLTDKIDKSGYVPAAWNAGIYKGKVYATPVAFSTISLYYNTDLFEKAGIKEPPKNWEEFKAAAEKLTKDGVSGFALPGAAYQETTFTFTPFIYQAGGRLFNDDITKAEFNSPAGVEALEFYASLVKSAPQGVINLKRSDAENLFKTGKVAMIHTGPWYKNNLKAENNPTKFSTTVLPQGKQASTLATVDSLVIFANSKHKDDAINFIKLRNSDEVDLEFAKFRGLVPYRVKNQDNAELKADKLFAPFLEQTKVGQAYPSLASWPQIDQAIYTAVQEVLTGKKSAKQALDDAAKKVDEYLAKEKK